MRVVADNRARHASHLLPRIADVTPNEQEAKLQQQRAKTRRVRVEGKR